jgi:hypothetical protein
MSQALRVPSTVSAGFRVQVSAFRLLAPSSHLPSSIFQYPARVVKWQTRTFEGRMPKGMRVQVPPRAYRAVARNL